jgi:hypothetical protein
LVPTPPFVGLQRTSQPLACIPRTTTSQTPITRVGFGATAKRAKHEAPRHSHFQLGGQFRSLVRTLCVRQGSWVKCRNFYSKWQPHLIYIYICHSHTSFYHYQPAHTSGHNSGPDALARRQCRAHVLAMLGRGAGRARSAVPRSDRAKSKRARSALALALAAKAL